MKEKALLLAGVTAAVLIVCFVVYNTYSNTEVESEQIAVVFPMDEMVSVEMFEETINDLYKETLVKSETESDIQEMAEAVEIGSNVENEEILLTDESTENVSETQTSNPSGGSDTTPAPQSSGDGSDNTGGGSTGGGNGLTPEQQAFLDSLGGGPYTGPTSAPAGDHSGSNHGIVMAQ